MTASLPRPIRWIATVLMTSLLGAVLVVGGADPAGATSNGAWSVEPASDPGQAQARTSFNYTMKPGDTLRDTVWITNLTDQEKTFKIYATDAYNTPADGAFALLEEKEKPTDVGSWVTMGVSEYPIPAMSMATVNFEVKVPEDAEPGDHTGAIVVADVEPERQAGDEGTSVAIKRRVGARLYLRVAGPVHPRLDIRDLTVEHHQPLLPYLTGRNEVTVSYTIANTGNVRLRPRTAAEIKGLFGRTVKSFPVKDLPELLPGGSILVTEHTTSLFPLDRMNAKVRVTADLVNTSRSQTFWAFPWLAIVILLVVVAAVVVGRQLLRRRARTGRPRGPLGDEPILERPVEATR